MSKKKQIKRIDIKEFRKHGYLQELNRQFLHPLGLALEVIIDGKKEKLGGVWDYRKDKEGIWYGVNIPRFTNRKRLMAFKRKADYVRTCQINRAKARNKKFGFIIEPIPVKNKK